MDENIIKKDNSRKILYYVIFIAYAIINFILMLYHEPWRDEIHAWLMAKELSIPELFVTSKFDGHPILWHLILMPFAKLDFPIITLNLISFFCVLISSYLFLFKTALPLPLKIFALFSVPFTYTYSAISRNYCLILLFLIIIAVYYPKRYDKPILYSVLICLLIHTHSLAWGLVAGLTITFHFHEIFLYFKKKNTAPIKNVCIGLFLIALNSILVVFELYGTSNVDYYPNIYPLTKKTLIIVSASLIFMLLYTVLALKTNYKELFILFLGFAFQTVIYLFVYSAIIFQRYILVFVMWLFYLLLITQNSETSRKVNYLYIIYFLATCILGLSSLFNNIKEDFALPYSSAKEMANYINENVPENTTLLVDAAIIGQSIIPYLEDGYQFYDIAYQEYVTCAAVSHDREKISAALENLDQYSGKYIVLCNNFENYENFELLYKTEFAIQDEFYSLYYIP